MPEILTNWAPQAYGIWGLFVLVAGWMAKTWLETRKLSASDRQARSEGFARQVEILLVENRNLQADLTRLRAEYDEYRQLRNTETDQLRGEIIGVRDNGEGLRRRIDELSMKLADLGHPQNAPEATKSIERVRRIHDNDDRK